MLFLNFSDLKWTWIAGSAIANQGGAAGVLGQYDNAARPGGRSNHAWLKDDSTGRYLLFGGYGWDFAGACM